MMLAALIPAFSMRTRPDKPYRSVANLSIVRTWSRVKGGFISNQSSCFFMIPVRVHAAERLSYAVRSTGCTQLNADDRPAILSPPRQGARSPLPEYAPSGPTRAA